MFGAFLMLSLVSAGSYDFDYERPNRGQFVYPAFLMARDLGSSNVYVKLVYDLLSITGFLDNQLTVCEARVEKLEKRSCGGGTHTVVEVMPDYSDGDLNGDCRIDGTDLSDYGSRFLPIKKAITDNFGQQIC